ncbi:MAG: hypothetical protein IJF71_03190 [Clostridia bacterium]|nr:hypothetical protein [Clostridia bacterium]
MLQRITEIKLRLDEPEALVRERAAKKAGIPLGKVKYFKITKKAVDARDKRNIALVYAAELSDKEETHKPFTYPKVNNAPPIAIAGFGPAGIFAALTLAKAGFKPVVYEKGGTATERTEAVRDFWNGSSLDESTNVQFGEGGAGTFSDGKLTTNIRDPLCEEVLREFVEAGAPQEIAYLAKPHIGTDHLVKVVVNLRKKIKALGGTVLFHQPLLDFETKNGRISSVISKDGKQEFSHLILATGHSARDIYRLLLSKGFPLTPKVFSVGVRIEHLQSNINKSQYGALAGHPSLPPAEYKMAYHGARSAYTFCMCPGGTVVASQSERDAIVTNGMSAFARDGVNANAALLVNVTPEDFPSHPLGGVMFQEQLERLAFRAAGESHRAPCQRNEDFIKNRISHAFGEVKPTYQPGITFCNLNDILPEYVSGTLKEAISYMDRRLHGFAHPDALLTGVETRSSAPVRIERGENKQSTYISGIYPCGEGCGYAGGIMSAAVDGIKVARAIIEQYISLE